MRRGMVRGAGHVGAAGVRVTPNARLLRAVVACLGLALALASGARAQIVEDGGRLTVGSRTYRLWGLVVPDRDTACMSDWNAGDAASRHLEHLTSGRAVDCEYRGKDSDGLTLAVCRADGTDIGADMVRAGLAWSHGSQSHDYVLDEGLAMSRFQGVHAHGCRVPALLLNRPKVAPQ
jgi:endonuclease YncB( thermonuclease family)